MISIFYLLLFGHFSIKSEKQRLNSIAIANPYQIEIFFLLLLLFVANLPRFFSILSTCTMICLVFISVWMLFHGKKKLYLNCLFDWPRYKTALEMSSLKFSALIQSPVNIHIENALKRKIKTITLVKLFFVVLIGIHSE